VLKVSPSGIVVATIMPAGVSYFSATIAMDQGGGVYATNGDGFYRINKDATMTKMYSGAVGSPWTGGPLFVDASGAIYVSRHYGSCIQKLAQGKPVAVIAGQCSTGNTDGYSGDGGFASAAQIAFPYGLAVDPSGKVYFLDSGNDAIRLLTPVQSEAVTVVGIGQVGAFRRGETAAAYDVTVRNLASAGPTRGAVTVSLVLPAGLGLTAISGIGWNCSGVNCARSDVLNAGASYPPIRVTVGVGRDVAAQITTSVLVSGGGAPMAGARVTTNVESSSRPTIFSVVNGASFKAGSSDGSWISILGENFGTSTRPWKSSDFLGDRLPTAIDDIYVSINGIAAAIAYVSPTQVNAQVPATGRTGPVSVVVSNSTHGVSDFGMLDIQRAAPGIFTFSPGGGKYPAALVVRVDGQVEYLGPASLFGSALLTRPARAGETIVLYATGLGPTNPAVPAGVAFSGAARTIDPVSVVIGGLKATVAFSGLVSPGLYQVNVVVPNGLDKESPLTLEVGGSAAQAGLVVAIAPN
jgi:uncharacterized protein (TIGR03437 family)